MNLKILSYFHTSYLPTLVIPCQEVKGYVPLSFIIVKPFKHCSNLITEPTLATQSAHILNTALYSLTHLISQYQLCTHRGTLLRTLK